MEYKDVVERFARFTLEQAALFSAGCVYRLLPIVQACATPTTAASFARLSDLLWEAGRSPEKEELIQALQSAPELMAESAEEIHYWAHHALAMMFEAAQGDERGSSPAGAEACSALARNIAGDFDAILTEDEGGPEVTLPPQGIHEQLESAAQGEVVEILTAGSDRQEWIEGIKAASRTAVAGFTEDLPRFLRLAGWA
jgi:hypothetical protein